MNDRTTVRPRPTHYLNADARVVRPGFRSVYRRLVLWLVVLGCFGAVAGVAAGCFVLATLQRTPREWAPYLQRRALRHNPFVVGGVDLVANWLVQADRLQRTAPVMLPANLGASAERSGPVPEHLHIVASLQELRDAVAAARPGDVIQLQSGRYRFTGQPILFSQSGTADAPITVRALRLGDVVIESDTVETFKVQAPYWHFENLTMRGVCGDHTWCEHAFHIVGGASDIVIRNNLLEDYNAQLKINGEQGKWPDRGLVEGNTLTDTAPRMTTNSITPIDLVGANDWRVSDNTITDFIRGVDGAATYAAFFKGAGQGNIFERNVVVCEWKLKPTGGERVGLSLGGGGTDITLRREQGHTGLEQVGGVIRDNLIAFCNDDGVYLNKAARSTIDHNTLLDTAGIDARFVETSATVTANLVDGAIRGREGGSVEAWDNSTPLLLGLFVGLHPQRSYFADPAKLDLTWRRKPASVVETDHRPDLCGHARGTESSPGAFDDYTPCLVPGQ